MAGFMIAERTQISPSRFVELLIVQSTRFYLENRSALVLPEQAVPVPREEHEEPLVGYSRDT
jgi:hypothetical protein